MPGAIVGSGGIEIRRGAEAQDITPFVHRFVWSESLIAGGWTWMMTFDTEDWKDWKDLILGKDKNPGRHFRLKAQEGGIDSTTSWLRAYVDGTPAADIRGRTLSVKVQGADVRLEIQQKSRTRAHLATKVSDVIRRVASENDLVADVQDTLGSRDRWQWRTDDWAYIRHLAHCAATSSRRGDSYLWVDDDTLRFRAPDLGVPSDRRYDLAEVDNRVDKTMVTYHGRAVDRRGGSTLLGVSYDVLLGKPIRFTMDAQAASTQPSLADQVPRSMAGGNRTIPLLSQGLDLVEETTRGTWGLLAPRYFTMRIESRPDLTIRPGAVIELQANLNERQNLPIFGRYVVLEVQHVLVGSDIRTTLACFRREAFQGAEAPTGSSVSSGGTRDRAANDQSERPRSVLVAEVLP